MRLIERFIAPEVAALRNELDTVIRERDGLRLRLAELQAALKVYEMQHNARPPLISTWNDHGGEVEYRQAVPESV